MKKLILILLVLMTLLSFCAVFAENGTVTVPLDENTRLTLKYLGYERDGGLLKIRISGFGSEFHMNKGYPYSPYLAQIRTAGKTYETDKVEMSTSGTYTFAFKEGAPLPEMVYVKNALDNRTFRLWYDVAVWNPDRNPEILQNGDQGSEWCLARFIMRTPETDNGIYTADVTRDLLGELIHPAYYLRFRADGNISTNFDIETIRDNMIPIELQPGWPTVGGLKFFFKRNLHLANDNSWRWKNGHIFTMPSGDSYEMEYDETSGTLSLSMQARLDVKAKTNKDGGIISGNGHVTFEAVQEYVPCADYNAVIDAALNPPIETVLFGRYEQDNDPDNGPEMIEWNVLEEDGENVLLISKFILDTGPYNTAPEKAGWDKSTLRTWLNREFLEAAFTPEEQERILTSTVTADLNPDNPECVQGEATEDRIWALSIDDADRLFAVSENRIAWPTAYARARGAKTTGIGAKETDPWSYWLRTIRYVDSFTPCAAIVWRDGRIFASGNEMDSAITGIRPVIRIRAADIR